MVIFEIQNRFNDAVASKVAADFVSGMRSTGTPFLMHERP
jgi:hypothetical protein